MLCFESPKVISEAAEINMVLVSKLVHLNQTEHMSCHKASLCCSQALRMRILRMSVYNDQGCGDKPGGLVVILDENSAH